MGIRHWGIQGRGIWGQPAVGMCLGRSPSCLFCLHASVFYRSVQRIPADTDRHRTACAVPLLCEHFSQLQNAQVGGTDGGLFEWDFRTRTRTRKNCIDYEHEYHFIEHEHEFRASQLSVGVLDARRAAFMRISFTTSKRQGSWPWWNQRSRPWKIFTRRAS